LRPSGLGPIATRLLNRIGGAEKRTDAAIGGTAGQASRRKSASCRCSIHGCSDRKLKSETGQTRNAGDHKTRSFA